MRFMEKLQAGLIRFMYGRSGPDQLSRFTMIAGLVLILLDGFLMTGLIHLAGLTLYVYTFFRMFSKNISKRRAENAKFLIWYEKAKKPVLRYWTRLKNCRQYKYFSCPQCRASIRMKRGMGEKEITCPGCRHTFKQKS